MIARCWLSGVASIACVVGVSGFGALQQAHAAPVLAVTVDSGPLAGIIHNGMRAWLGVPFAAPPLGAARWTPPRQPIAWKSVRKADRFAASCAQEDTMGSFAAPSIAEDCLYLNVYSPLVTPPGGAPVMVWFFGGGFRAGSANDYDPTSLVRHGVVVVTAQYRLGILGFFLNPALGADNATGNYGILDQIFSLQWVQRNIDRFGGSPGRVTIFGESAGARAVALLLVSPLAKDLFSSAILESFNYEGTKNPAAEALAMGRRFARESGCHPEDVACLRGLSVQQILDAQRRTPPGLNFGGIIGGPDLPEAPQAALRGGRFNRVPIIIGWNHDEFAWRSAITEVDSGKAATEADYQQATRQFARTDPARASQDAAAVAAAYPLSGFSAPALAIARIQTDWLFVCGSRRFLRDVAGKTPVWAYEFDVRDAPQYNRAASFAVGASHTSEIPFLFEGFHGASGKPTPLSAVQSRLALQMQHLWTNLTAAGDPNIGKPAPHWPAAIATGLPVLVLRTGGSLPSDEVYTGRHCDLWDSIAAG
jgi:para-nitrobenzyl esterase